jgi:translocation and assembly module TamA
MVAGSLRTTLHRLTLALALVTLACGGAFARSGDIQLTVIGDKEMGEELKKLSQDLDKDQPLTGDSLSLLQGAQVRRARMVSALRSRGYYDSRVVATIAQQPIEDASALDAIDAAPEAQKVDFVFNVATGPIYRVVSLDIDGPADVVSKDIVRSKLDLLPGQPADAAAIIGTENQILSQVREHGYALARMERREVVIDHATREAHITYYLAVGPTATMGPVRFSGTDKIDVVYLQKRVPFKQGEPYAPDKVNALRDRLTSLGVFSSVRIKPADKLTANGELPIDVELQDRLPRTIGFGISYETILGAGVNASWLHRNLFGQAESLRVSGAVNHIGQGSMPQDLGYSLKLDFLKPDLWRAEQDLYGNAQVLREVLPAYTRNAALMGFGLNRVLTPHLKVSGGFSAETEQITALGVTSYYTLVGLPLSGTLNEANSETDPTKGYKLVLNATPYADLNHNGNMFAILKAIGTGYLDVSGEGRSVIAARAAFGSIPGGGGNGYPYGSGNGYPYGSSNGYVSIPPDKLFYAGGGGSIRGFTYQSAGPRDAFNNPLGGASLIETSLEFRQRIGKSWGAVAFIDAGGAYADTIPNFSQMEPRVGTGVGVRYYTSFGPARLDFGLPLNPREGDAAFGVYVSLGQSF